MLRSLVNHLPAHVYAVDQEGKFILANDAFLQLIRQVTQRDIIGKTPSQVFPQPLGAEMQADNIAVVNSGQPVLNREGLCLITPAPDCWNLTTKVPLREPGGEIIGLVAISHDISEQRRSRQQLQLANAELQQANTALKEMQLQLIHMERLQSIGRLAAGVAHEVKNPLAVLRMGLDFLLNVEFPPDASGDTWIVLEDMQTAIQRADTIIMGLLNFSAPGELELKPVNVNQLVEHSLSLVRHELTAHAFVVEQQGNSNGTLALLDEQKIDQVLVNLFTNAFHAMPDGGKLTVRTTVRTIAPQETQHDAGSREGIGFRSGDEVVQIEIDDTGTGIPPDKLDRIFDPFFTTKETGKGTGLGLTVARKIVELHGGSLTLSNRMEGGARATLTFKTTKETK